MVVLELPQDVAAPSPPVARRINSSDNGPSGPTTPALANRFAKADASGSDPPRNVQPASTIARNDLDLRRLDQVGPSGGMPLAGGGHPYPDAGFELLLRRHIETFRPRCDARFHASERRRGRTERCARRPVVVELPKSPLLPRRRVAWRLGLGVRRRTRRTTKNSAPDAI